MNKFKTPLRYPGGKQRLSPFIHEILIANQINGHYVEPYAGGAGIAIELLLTKKVNHIHLNDSDFGIYSFWYSVLNRTEELCKLILTASLTVDEWRRRQAIVKKCDRRRILELGFSVFYLNRCNRSGVLSAGLIGGINQNGNYKMDARFSRNDLIQRIQTIALFKDQITVTNFDAEAYIENYIPNLPPNTLVYLDPPYYEKGSELYLNAYHKSDHARIANTIQESITHKWVLSYDGVPDILSLYSQRRHFLYDLQYNAAKVYKGKEVFVFCDNIELPETCSLKHIEEGMKNLSVV
ncbi:MAG TPA: DNA adenine methylase [Sediminibacterium sp.]|nr:DNA adenine methylase [Sediminibacterium sp.]